MKVDGTGFTRVASEIQKLKEWYGKRRHFKVLARSNNAAMADEEQTMHKAQMLIHGLKTTPLPLLFRQYKRVSLNDEREENKLMQVEAGRTGENTLEFIIETAELGVIMIRVEPEHGGYMLRLLVETGRTGKILEKGLTGLQQIISLILQEKKINLAICRWEVIPLLDIHEIKETLHKFSYLLDRKV